MKNFQNKIKIIKVSRQLRAVARIALIFWTAGLLIFLLASAASLNHGGNAQSRFLAGGGITEMALAMMVSLNFFRFFDRLKNGELFDAKTVGYLQNAGQWWLAFWIFDLVFTAICHAWFNSQMPFSFGHLFAGLVVTFVAWLLKEAQTLQEEQQFIV